MVISPLIALMKDQVESLTALGIPAARLDSSLEYPEVRKIYDQMVEGSLKLPLRCSGKAGERGILATLVPLPDFSPRG